MWNRTAAPSAGPLAVCRSRSGTLRFPALTAGAVLVQGWPREAYLSELEYHIASLRKECSNVYIDYEVLNTTVPLDQALFQYLALRSRRI